MNLTRKINNKIFVTILLIIVILLVLHVNAFAADASIAVIGGDEEHEIDEIYNVTVEITSLDQIGTYYIELEYDSKVASYISGADSNATGTIVLTGTGVDKSITYNISFKNINDGKTGVTVKSAVVNDLADKAMSVTADASTVISAPDIPIIGRLKIENGQDLYVLDQSCFVPDIIGWDYHTVQGIFSDNEVTYVTDISENIHILCFTDGTGNYYAYAVNNAESVYPLNTFTDFNGKTWTYASVLAALNLPDKMIVQPISEDFTVYAIDGEGNGGFYNINNKNQLITWEESRKEGFEIKPWMIITAIVIILVIVTTLIIIITKKRKAQVIETEIADDSDDVEMELIDLNLDESKMEELLEEKGSEERPKSIDLNELLDDKDIDKVTIESDQQFINKVDAILGSEEEQDEFEFINI